MAQFARPDADITVGNWTTSPLYESINETASDTSDSIVGPNKQDGTCDIGLSTVTDPAVSTGHIIRITANMFGVPNTGINLLVKLYCGTTLITTYDGDWLETWQTFSYTLSTSEADAITDYADLHVEFVQDYITGAQGRCYVAWFEFEVPNAGGTTHYGEIALSGQSSLTVSATVTHQTLSGEIAVAGESALTVIGYVEGSANVVNGDVSLTGNSYLGTIRT